MVQKSNKNQPGQKGGSLPDRSSRSSDLDDAVTTEISDILTKAFDEDQAEYPSDLLMTDASLSGSVDLENDDVLAPGFLLRDRFEIVELVHTAGMSHVYKAIDQRRFPEGAGDVHVAIKMMRSSVASNDQARLSLQREAAKAQSLSHPNIINIFDFDDHDGQFFLVMEWLEGESVNALLRRTSGEGVEKNLARTVITSAATGVQHAHRNDVVHADINPSNIFITDTHEIKLLDFGVARSASVPEQSEGVRFTWATQTYASPEVLSGSTPAVEDDVFSFACVVYRLLSGKHPFGGTLSLVARHKNLLVEAIPGLSAREWEVLRRALSYERSDRPSSVGEFVTWGAIVDGDDESVAHPARRLMSPQRTWSAAVAAIAILAVGAWLFQRATDDEPVVSVESALPAAPVAVEPVAQPAISASEALVIAATQALNEGQLVAPDEVNARALFRVALSLESDNAEALRGLRTISNHFVQQAHEALNSEDPIEAYAALSVATETDSANPAIGIVEQLLVVKGNGELTDARLAVTTGDVDLAVQRLSRAEQYRHIDPLATQTLREQIEERRRSDLLLDRLARADEDIKADRLLLPEGGNAHALLLELHGQYGDDPRLLAAMERLGERLLTRAALAISATNAAQAIELLDAVDALGVLTYEVEAARSSLIAADSAADTQDAQVAQDSKVTPVVDEQPGGAPDSGDVQAPQATEGEVESTMPQASASEPPLLEETGPEAVSTPAGPEIRRISLQELGITKYVAPTFPRGALRRKISGLVEVQFVVSVDGNTESVEVLHSEPGDVFSKSAVDAVKQWRFEPREEVTTPRIILRFEQAQ